MSLGKFTDITADLTDERLQKLTYLQLCSAIDEVEETKDKLMKENVLLEKYIQTVGPKDSTPITRSSALSTGTVKVLEPDVVRSQRSLADHFITMPIEEKCEIAMNEIEDIKVKMKKLHDYYYKIITPCKIKLEEISLRKRDLQQDINDFNRDVVLEGVNIATGTVMFEKVLLYFDRSVKNKEIQLERCRLNISTLRTQNTKLGEQLKQKEELGDSLREVDYNQLKIENAQFMEKVEDRNQAMLKVKYLMAVSLQLLAQQKMRLRQLIQQAKEMKHQIELRNDNIKKIALEINDVIEERNKMGRRIKHLKYQLDNYRVPDVMEYINKQAEVYELKKVVNDWKRRVGLAERSLVIKSKLWNVVKKKYKVHTPVENFDFDKAILEDLTTTEESESEFESTQKSG